MRIKTLTLLIFSIVIALTVLLTSTKGLADTEVRGLIDQDTHWTLDKSPYVAVGNLAVDEGVTLTIEPGVTVKFKPNTTFPVDGTLVARGTQEMPITFTAYQDKEPGSWGYILFSDSSTPTELDDAENYIQGSILEYSIIEYAGGVDDTGAAVEVNTSNFLVDHCTISHSAAEGISMDSDKSGKAVIRNSTISDNKGRGIYVSSVHTVTITNNITGNNEGRGIYVSSVHAVTITNNITGNNGGGIYVSGDTATITDNTITENAASNGGGIYVSGDTATITKNTIRGNTTTDSFLNARGGGIYVSGSAAITSNNITGNIASCGGGIYVSNIGTATIINNIITGNTSTLMGNMVCSGGGIHVSGTATITDNTITENTASAHGGGIAGHHGTATITNNTITGNTANSAGGIYVSGTATITDNTITENTASYNGGGIGSYGTATITNNTITGNTALKGTATYLGGSIEDFSSNKVVDNKASEGTNTSTIYISSVPNQFKNNCIYNNETDFDIYYALERGTDNMDATENYWGTTDEEEIGTRIYDFFDDAGKGFVNVVPFLDEDERCSGDGGSNGTPLIVDAGKDRAISHPNNGGKTQIGGNPTASGGKQPYTYSWSPKMGLDNSNIANPTATPTATTTYTVTVTDSSSPAREASDSVTVNIDNTPPKAPDIDINSTPGNKTVTMSKATITVEGSGESDASIQSATLHRIQGGVTRDSSDVKEYLSISNGNISGSFDLGELADVDEIQLVIILRNDAFSESEPGWSNKLLVDKENPTIKLQQPGNGSYFNTVPIIISGIAADDTGVIRVEVDTGEGFVVVEGTNEWHYSFEPTTFGEYTVMARAFDGVGRSSEKATCTFRHFSYLPTAAIEYPLDGTELTGKVEILGSAGDVDDDYSDFSYTLTYKLENAEGVSSSKGFVEITTVAGAPVQDDKLGVWDLSVLVEGEYTLRLTVKNSDARVDVTRNNLQVKGRTPPVTFKLNFDKGWNLISFPGDVIEPSPDDFWDDEIFYILNADYNPPDAFELGEGYWVLAIQDTEKEVKLLPKEIYTRDIKRGWNLIGSAYGEACIPEGVIQLNHWNAETKESEPASRIEWGIGYWALVLKDSEITVDGRKPCHLAPPLQKSNIPPLWTLPIQLMDADLATMTRLTIGINSDAKSGFDSRFDVALPPPPPGEKLPKAALLLDGDFPLRLTKQIQPVPKTGTLEFLLQVSNPAGDAVLSWDATQIPDDRSLVLIAPPESINMAQQSTYSLPKGEREIVLVLKQASKQPLPQATALLPNYPNPFNPETWIPYQLADSAQVLLTIYDVHGHIVRKFNIGQKPAGIYFSRQEAAYWDGKNDLGEKVSSGLYFYRLKTGNFSDYRRMVIAK